MLEVTIGYSVFASVSYFFTLREKCPYWEFFWSVFCHIRTEYGEIRTISPYLVWMRENTDQKNSEYWHFSGCVNYDVVVNVWNEQGLGKKTNFDSGFFQAGYMLLCAEPKNT